MLIFVKNIKIYRIPTMKKHIPNIITLLNLSSGFTAILLATQGHLNYAAYLVFAGIFFDFFDGFVARILKTSSELGLQLDSLADMVTSGIAPGIVLFILLHNTDIDWNFKQYISFENGFSFLPFTGLLLSLGAAYRLAKFNVDERQDHDFIGLPTPAMAVFVMSLPLISLYGNYEWAVHLVKEPYFLSATGILGALLMNSELPMFSLKLQNFSLKQNALVYVFLSLSILLLIFFQIVGIPLIIIMYIVLSFLQNFFLKHIFQKP